VSAALPFVIPSEAEGSAVLFSTHDPFLKVIFDRSAAQWGDLLFLSFPRKL
jgi:hypothetical protein